MGYDLHITRAKRWIDSESRPISAEEWLAIVERDPELRLAGTNGAYFAYWNVPAGKDDGEWLDWHGGEIFSKHPSEALIEKMVQIAKALSGTVQGDDGEVYPGGGRPPFTVPPSFSEIFARKIASLRWWLRSLRGRGKHKQELAALAARFKPGQRVKDVYGKEAVVIAVDTEKPSILGKISVRYDDGRELHFALAACGLTPLNSENSQQIGISKTKD
jgi:hypothetical protein